MPEFPNKNINHHIGVEFLLLKTWISWSRSSPATAHSIPMTGNSKRRQVEKLGKSLWH